MQLLLGLHKHEENWIRIMNSRGLLLDNKVIRYIEWHGTCYLFKF